MNRAFSSVANGFRTWASMPMALFMLMFLVLQSVVMAYNTPLSYPPDEIPHLSYVRDSIQSGTGLPDFKNGKIMGFGQPNYLAHPPLYYSALGAVGKMFSLDPKAHYLIFRVISLSFVGIGLLFMVLTAREFGMSQGTTALTLFAASGVPMFAYLAGSVTNDTLLYTGMAMSFYGLARSLNPEHAGRPTGAYLALLTGALITFLTKATGMAFLVFFFGAFAALNLRQLQPALLLRQTWRQGMAFALVIGGYYLATRWHHGSLFPRPSDLYAMVPPASPLDFAGYSQEYLYTMWRRLPGILSHLSVAPIAERWVPAFYAMICLPVVGWLVVRFSSPLLTTNRSAIRYFDALALATLATVTLHLVFGYRAYLGNGVLSGLQPRYYAYLLPVIWFPFFVLCQPGWFKQSMTCLLAASALVVFWASSPFVQLKQQQALQDLPQNLTYSDRSALKQHALNMPMRDTATGHLDTLTLSNGELRGRGWTFDAQRGEKVQRLWIAAHDQFVASVPVQVRRDDVAAALGTDAALNAGFAFTARKLPANWVICDIRVIAEFRDGSFGQLRSDGCPP